MTKRRVWFAIVFGIVAVEVVGIAFAGKWISQSPIVRMACDHVGR